MQFNKLLWDIVNISFCTTFFSLLAAKLFPFSELLAPSVGACIGGLVGYVSGETIKSFLFKKKELPKHEIQKKRNLFGVFFIWILLSSICYYFLGDFFQLVTIERWANENEGVLTKLDRILLQGAVPIFCINLTSPITFYFIEKYDSLKHWSFDSWWILVVNIIFYMVSTISNIYVGMPLFLWFSPISLNKIVAFILGIIVVVGLIFGLPASSDRCLRAFVNGIRNVKKTRV